MSKLGSPTKEEVKAARIAAGLTQKQAAECIGRNQYQRWGEFERGSRQMSGAEWEMFLVKTNQHPQYTYRTEPLTAAAALPEA